MLQAIPLFLLGVSCRLVSGGGLDLPSYIPKCSLSDPKFNQCLVEKANQVVPIIAKGDAVYNIPPMCPLIYGAMSIYGTGLKFNLYNSRSDDWNKLVFTDILLDFKNGKATATGVLDRLMGIAENYTIIEDKILDMPVYGHGKFNMTVVGVKIKYSGRIRFFKKGEDLYVDYFDSKADISCKRSYIHFENLQCAEKPDFNAYMNQNWKTVFSRLKPTFDEYCDAFVNYPLQAIIRTVPFHKIFLD